MVCALVLGLCVAAYTGDDAKGNAARWQQAAGADLGAVPPGHGGGSSIGDDNDGDDGEARERPPADALRGPDKIKLPRVSKPEPPATGSGPGPAGSFTRTGTTDVSLTFDDGPDPTFTPKILALLREHGVKATFCVLGFYAEKYPQLIQAIVRDGHTMCSHTWYHDFGLGRRSATEIKNDLERTNVAIRRAVPGVRVPYFRHPGGNWTNRAVAIAKQLGMTSIHWHVDPQDWRKPPAGQIYGNVIHNTQPGSIVLLHDAGGDRTSTYVACKMILPELKRRGFSLIALP